MSVDQKNDPRAVSDTVQPSDDIENLYRALQHRDAPDAFTYQEIKQRETLEDIYQRWPLLTELAQQLEAEKEQEK